VSPLNMIASNYIVMQKPNPRCLQRRIVFQFPAKFIHPSHSLGILSISLHILLWIDRAILCTFLLAIYRIHIHS
jgi:hypothetical protein